MKFKRGFILVLIMLLSLSFLLSACNAGTDKRERPDEPFAVTENTATNSIELSHNGITYQLWGVVGNSKLCDTKIGFRDDDSDSTIYAVKGYDSTQWILNNPAEGGFMENSFFLLKAVSVTEIPTDLEQYKQY